MRLFFYFCTIRIIFRRSETVFLVVRGYRNYLLVIIFRTFYTYFHFTYYALHRSYIQIYIYIYTHTYVRVYNIKTHKCMFAWLRKYICIVRVDIGRFRQLPRQQNDRRYSHKRQKRHAAGV